MMQGRSQARLLLDAFDAGRQISPLSAANPDLTLEDGYRIAGEIHDLRLARGERVAGRKIGFTNRNIWDTYGVHGPLWGWVYEEGLIPLPGDGVAVSLPDLPEIRIEPEIVFRFGREPAAAMTDQELASCIDGVAHGFELVFSIYPGWRFTAADSAAAFGMHAALLLGPWQSPAPLLQDAGAPLSRLSITLRGPGGTLSGSGADVLGGPLQALRFLLETLGDSGAGPISAGEVVTTGTLTDAALVSPGETWATRIEGASLPGLSVTFAQA